MAIGKLLLNIRKADNIKRYQVEKNIVPRSVSEHTDFVMKLCYVLAKWEERKFGNHVNWKKLYGTTFHDSIEAWTGDILSYTKRTVPEMVEAVRLTEESFFENSMKKDIPTSWVEELKQYVLNPKDGSLEGKILEAADTLDVIFECREEVIRQNKEPFEAILRSSLDKLMEIELESCRYFLKYALNDLKVHAYYSDAFKAFIEELYYDETVFENKRALPDEGQTAFEVKVDYGEAPKEKPKGIIKCLATGKTLSIQEIKDLKLLVNPLDSSVCRVKNHQIIRDNNFIYLSN